MKISCVLLLVFLATYTSVRGRPVGSTAAPSTTVQALPTDNGDGSGTDKNNQENGPPEPNGAEEGPGPDKSAVDSTNVDDGNVSDAEIDQGSSVSILHEDESDASSEALEGGSSNTTSETSQEGGSIAPSEVAGGGSNSTSDEQGTSATSKAPDATTVNNLNNVSDTTGPLTTPSPGEVAAPSNTDEPAAAPNGKTGRAFDGWSFFGGIMLTVSILAVSVVGFKYYKARGTGSPCNYDRF